MKKPFKIAIGSLVVIAILGLVAFGFRDKIKTKFFTKYVATVGKQKITEDEYRYFLLSTKSSMEQNAQTDADKKTLWASKIGTQSAEDYAKDQALDTAVTFKILLSKANAANYKLSADETKKTNEQLDSEVSSLGTGDAGKTAFEKQYGLTVDKVRAISLDMALVQKYYADQLKKITATDDEIKKYYDANVTKYQQVTVRHVLFMTIDQTTQEALPQAEQKVKKKQAEDILAQVKAGADIGALAKKYSEDTGSKDKNGEYTFARGQMVQQFEDWSFKAKVGDVGLVQTQYGYHVIKLIKILGLDDVKATVKNDLISKKFTDEVAQWKKSTEYAVKKNTSVLSTIKVSSLT